jgi:predicted SprT family Zn-dependent metalloprotease
MYEIISKANLIVNECIVKFSSTYVAVPKIKVELSNRMTRTWGYATTKNGVYVIKLNAKVCKDNHDSKAFHDLVVHEFCHIADHVVNKEWGHGNGWKIFMRFYGLPANVYVTNKEKEEVGYVSVKRKIKKYQHACSCKNHIVHGKIHNKIMAGSAYTCRSCKTKLSTSYITVKS